MSTTIEAFGRLGPVFGAAALAWVASAAAYSGVAVNKGGKWLERVAPLVFVAGLVLTGGLLGQRWVEAGRPPFKSLFESLLLFAFCTAVLHVVLERYWRIAWLGVGAGLMLAVTYVYAASRSDVEIVNLPAALQSAWFVPHVVVYFFGYAALFFAFAAAVVHLWKPHLRLQMRRASGERTSMSYAGFMHLANVLGFGLLTVGLVMGSVWAKSAWGDWWVWDPKENWALVSWLVFCGYLHLRRLPDFTERTGAWVTVAGFVAVAFTYLGMHLLPTAEGSAHVYQ